MLFFNCKIHDTAVHTSMWITPFQSWCAHYLWELFLIVSFCQTINTNVWLFNRFDYYSADQITDSCLETIPSKPCINQTIYEREYCWNSLNYSVTPLIRYSLTQTLHNRVDRSTITSFHLATALLCIWFIWIYVKIKAYVVEDCHCWLCDILLCVWSIKPLEVISW